MKRGLSRSILTGFALAAQLCPGILLAQPSEPAVKPGSAFQDCANACPVMIVIPAGTFMMGSPDGELDWEATGRPRHEVVIANAFAVSKFEVTYAEWDACAAAGACPHAEDSWGRGQMPVTNVSWSDARRYLAWLSRSAGKEYRLLTEAEWEYVARAGSTSRYGWGDDPGKGNANCDGCGSRWDLKQTAPVGSFEPNAFGLYDLHGNVWEWVEDSWHASYDSAPIDGRAWVEGGDPNFRIIRGGSWRNEAELIRADVRVKRIIGVRFDTLGFRVARTLSP